MFHLSHIASFQHKVPQIPFQFGEKGYGAWLGIHVGVLIHFQVLQQDPVG